MFNEPRRNNFGNFGIAAFIVLVVLILFAVWMQRFHVLSVGTDLMIFDKLSGKTTIVNASGVATEVIDKVKVASPSFNDIKLPNLNSSAALFVKWRDGKLYYSFSVLTFSEIISKGKSSGNASFTISLVDRDNFEIKNINLELTRMVKTVNEQGKGQSLTYVSSVPMSYSDFKEISSWELFWAGFPEK